MTKIPLNVGTNGILLIILIVVYGIIGSHFIMRLNFLDSFYYTITTIATVGFGDITPHTIIEKLFSITLAIGGIGIVAYIFTIVLTNFSEKMMKFTKEAKIMKKIERMDDYYVICGYGRVGQAVVKNLDERNHNIIIIETDEEKITKAKDKDNIQVFKKDATDNKFLKELLTEKCNSVIVTTGSDVTNLFIVLSVREISEDMLIVSRLSDLENKNKLRQAGADKLISPEIIGGEDIFYHAIENLTIKVTAKNSPEDLVKRANLVYSKDCRIESIDFHIPGIEFPLSQKISREYLLKLRHDLENRNLSRFERIGEFIHSEWITCPNEGVLEDIKKEFEKDSSIIGINLSEEEIYEINSQ